MFNKPLTHEHVYDGNYVMAKGFDCLRGLHYISGQYDEKTHEYVGLFCED